MYSYYYANIALFFSYLEIRRFCDYVHGAIFDFEDLQKKFHNLRRLLTTKYCSQNCGLIYLINIMEVNIHLIYEEIHNAGIEKPENKLNELGELANEMLFTCMGDEDAPCHTLQ